MGVRYKLGMLERRLDGRRLFLSILLLVCSFLASQLHLLFFKVINRDKHKSLVFVSFESSLLGLVFLLVQIHDENTNTQCYC